MHEGTSAKTHREGKESCYRNNEGTLQVLPQKAPHKAQKAGSVMQEMRCSCELAAACMHAGVAAVIFGRCKVLLKRAWHELSTTHASERQRQHTLKDGLQAYAGPLSAFST